jgi:hypothetical protein
MLTLDAVHGTILTSDGPQGVANFDWESVRHDLDGESIEDSTVTMSDAGAAVALILGWACKSNRLDLVGARVASLLAHLDPTNAPHGRSTLAAIAAEAGCSKALLSRELLELRDQCGIHLTLGKRSFSRESCRTAQNYAVKAQVHAGQVRKDANPDSKRNRRKAKLSSELIDLNAIAD